MATCVWCGHASTSGERLCDNFLPLSSLVGALGRVSGMGISLREGFILIHSRPLKRVVASLPRRVRRLPERLLTRLSGRTDGRGPLRSSERGSDQSVIGSGSVNTFVR